MHRLHPQIQNICYRLLPKTHTDRHTLVYENQTCCTQWVYEDEQEDTVRSRPVSIKMKVKIKAMVSLEQATKSQT